MIDIKKYDYYLPKDLISQEPKNPRDFSRLFIYNTKTDKIRFDFFYNLDKYLPKKSFLVLNDTKVIPSRIWLRKKNGGHVLVLFLVNEIDGDIVKALFDRKVNIGEMIFFPDNNPITVIKQEKKIFYLKFDFSRRKLFELLWQNGKMPIPLYLRKTPLAESKIREKYQSIFAKSQGSAAAPTASLHFTDRVFSRLDKIGVKKLFTTLHVGMGTFAPITEKNIITKKLHTEYYEVEKDFKNKFINLKKNGFKSVAVGTTVVRTLETIFGEPVIANMNQKTSLFIFPPYEFKSIDHLITNFHLPKSSLMMLVDAFLHHKKAKQNIVDLYNVAVKEKFRFYSFGDAMLIL